MRPLPFVWPYALGFWAVSVWAFLPEFGIVRRARHSGSSADAKSLQVILFGMNAAFLAAFPLAWVPALHFGSTYIVPAFWLGVGLIVSGSLLRRHCFRMLGESFTGDVRASSEQQVVTRGAYSVLRHPSYTAGILLNAGVGFALGSWASALLLIVTSVAVYGYRIGVEERALAAAIGEPYRQFLATRKRLIPFVY
jgi:protein-S-isoprenylcysteine O-methyltransferase Ste14